MDRHTPRRARLHAIHMRGKVRQGKATGGEGQRGDSLSPGAVFVVCRVGDWGPLPGNCMQDSSRKKHAIYFNLNFCFAITENATCMRLRLRLRLRLHWSNNSYTLCAPTHHWLQHSLQHSIYHISSYSWVYHISIYYSLFSYAHVVLTVSIYGCLLSAPPLPLPLPLSVQTHLMSLKSNNNIVCAHNLTIKCVAICSPLIRLALPNFALAMHVQRF